MTSPAERARMTQQTRIMFVEVELTESEAEALLRTMVELTAGRVILADAQVALLKLHIALTRAMSGA
jgi:hypothetical protein